MGDELQGLIDKDVKSENGQTSLPKGTHATGRLIGLEHLSLFPTTILVTMRVDMAYGPGHRYLLELEQVDSVTNRTGGRSSTPAGTLLAETPEGAGSYGFRGGRVRLGRRFVTHWVTRRHDAGEQASQDTLR